MTNRFSIAGLSTACLALFLGSALLFAPLAAHAGPYKRHQAAAVDKSGAKTAPSKLSDAAKSKSKQTKSQAKSKADKGKLARGEPETTGSVSKGPAQEPYCDKIRRKLWVEGEGWVVRRVQTCQLTQN